MRAFTLMLIACLAFLWSAPVADAAKKKSQTSKSKVLKKKKKPVKKRVVVAKPAPLPVPVVTPPMRAGRQEGQLVYDGPPLIPASLKARLSQYSAIRSAAFMDFLPSGGMLISTRFSDAAQIHRVDTPLGDRKQLTFAADPSSGARSRPMTATGQFVYSKDQGGDEFFQLYMFDPATNTSTLLTEPQTRNEAPVFSGDGSRLVWSRATATDPNFDLMWMDLAQPASRRVILEGQGAIEPLGFSPDGAKLLYGRYESIAKSRRFLLDLATGSSTELTPELNVSYDGGEFTPDGKSVMLISDEGGTYARVIRLDLATGRRFVMSPADLTWDVESFDLSPDGRTLAYVINASGESQLSLMDVRRGKVLRSVDLPPGLVINPRFDSKGSRLGFSLNSGASPSDAYVLDVKKGALSRWTQSETGGIDPSSFAAPKQISFPTFDQVNGAPRQIPAFVYRPRTAEKAPVILFLHGGPEAQFRPSFSTTIQYWVNDLGFAVVAPNVRGSTGYGRDYVSLDNNVKREDSVKDMGAALDWIAQQPDLDASRVVVYGGSYGGYMAYAAMTHYNARLAGGISVVGISNWVSFLENTKGYRRDLRRIEYGDERDPSMRAFLQSISPLNKAGNITKPMLIVQGANDPRVPMSEAEQMVAKVRANGGDAWYLLALDEGHGFQKKQNQDSQRAVEAMFFKKVAAGQMRTAVTLPGATPSAITPPNATMAPVANPPEAALTPATQ